MAMELKLGGRVRMKKPHPCGGAVFVVTRVGMDVKLRCETCAHEVELPRAKAERAIKSIIKEEEA